MSGSDEKAAPQGPEAPGAPKPDERAQTATKAPEEQTAANQAPLGEEAAAPTARTQPGDAAADAERIKALEAEVDKWRDTALRERAEQENTRRRAEKAKQDTAAYAISGFARDLLSVADNLRRALDAVPGEVRAGAKVKAFIEGVEMTERELLAAFEKHGVKKVDPAGEKFDSNFHQAMAEVDAPGRTAGTVVDVYQPGYVLKDRLLRPAMVTVARAEQKPQAHESVDTTV